MFSKYKIFHSTKSVFRELNVEKLAELIIQRHDRFFLSSKQTMKRTSFKDSDGKEIGHQENILHFNLDLEKGHNGPEKKLLFKQFS